MNQQFNSLDVVEPIPEDTNDPLTDFHEEDALVNDSLIHEPLMEEAVAHQDTAVSTNGVSSTALLNHEESELFRAHWNEVQAKFVDEPRSAVQQADALVSEVIEKITQMFANEHTALEDQWNQGNDVSTEDLRMALQHYRSFFNRLVLKNEE